MNILVTGGAGFIGSHLVDALIDRGHRVRVLDALVSQVHEGEEPLNLNPQAEFVRGDVCDSNVLNRALDGMEAVYHEAAEVGVGQSMYQIQKYVRANDFGTAVLLEALSERRQQVRKLIVASSMSIYGEGAYVCPTCGIKHPQLRSNSQLLERQWEFTCSKCGSELRLPLPTKEDKPLFPTSVYAITKQDQEQFLLASDALTEFLLSPCATQRLRHAPGAFESLQRYCAIFSSRLLQDQSPMIFEDGEQTRDFIHVSDIVQANLLALEKDSADYQAINVGTGRATSVNQVAKLLTEGLGKDLKPEVVGKYREGDIRHCFADISRARKLLAYEPKVSLEDGIPELLGWVREQTATDRVAQATVELESRQLVR